MLKIVRNVTSSVTRCQHSVGGASMALATVVMLLSCFCQIASPAFSGYKLTEGYNKLVSPARFIDNFNPLEVSLRIRIIDVLSISEFQSELSLDVLVEREWKEPRLNFTETVYPGRLYALDPRESDKFWTPDLYVQGVRDFSTRKDDMALRYIILFHDKTISQMVRATIVMKCSFDFRLYPFDVQQCKMDFMSPLQPIEEQVLVWYNLDVPVEFYKRSPNTELDLPQYDVSLIHCPCSFTAFHVSGNVSALRLWVVLRREMKATVLELYLPTALFVCISWGSFLVRPEVVPGRMVLLVTTLLSLVTLFEASRTTAPPAQGVKSLDVWQLSCIVFVFLALVEYAVILYRLRGRFCRSTGVKVVAMTNGATSEAKRTGSSRPHVVLRMRSVVRRLMARRWAWRLGSGDVSPPDGVGWCALDRLSLITFPLTFLLFNVGYWSVHIQHLGQTFASDCEEPS